MRICSHYMHTIQHHFHRSFRALINDLIDGYGSNILWNSQVWVTSQSATTNSYHNIRAQITAEERFYGNRATNIKAGTGSLSSSWKCYVRSTPIWLQVTTHELINRKWRRKRKNNRPKLGFDHDIKIWFIWIWMRKYFEYMRANPVVLNPPVCTVYALRKQKPQQWKNGDGWRVSVREKRWELSTRFRTKGKMARKIFAASQLAATDSVQLAQRNGLNDKNC